MARSYDNVLIPVEEFLKQACHNYPSLFLKEDLIRVKQLPSPIQFKYLKDGKCPLNLAVGLGTIILARQTLARPRIRPIRPLVELCT